MSITVNTNMEALKIQRNLSNATNKMNTAMERMSSGSRINSASDDAAGLAVSTKLETTISGSKVASDNVKIGSNLLSTTEGTLDVVLDNLQRIRDLAEQAANGTYSAEDIAAIKAEAVARANEIDKLTGSSTFNGKKLFGDSAGAASIGITLQVGTQGSDTLNLSKDIFASATVTGLKLVGTAGGAKNADVAAAFADSTTARTFLADCDIAIQNLTDRQTAIGAAQNGLTGAADGLEIQTTNLTAANSTIKDADVAQESATYVAQKILQSASASLLTQANSAPQIALTLIQGGG